MTDELEKDYGKGSFITRFVSGGPKNYAYEIFSTKTGKTSQNCKVRGITLTANIAEKVNFETMKKMVHCFDPTAEANESITVWKEHDIVRKHIGKIMSKTTKKTYRIVYDKRVIRDGYITIPYGY